MRFFSGMLSRMKQILTLILVLTSVVPLSACMNTSTQWMPNGYYYQGNNHPITKPAPTRPWLSSEERARREKSSAPDKSVTVYSEDTHFKGRTAAVVSRSDTSTSPVQPSYNP